MKKMLTAGMGRRAAVGVGTMAEDRLGAGQKVSQDFLERA